MDSKEIQTETLPAVASAGFLRRYLIGSGSQLPFERVAMSEWWHRCRPYFKGVFEPFNALGGALGFFGAIIVFIVTPIVGFSIEGINRALALDASPDPLSVNLLHVFAIISIVVDNKYMTDVLAHIVGLMPISASLNPGYFLFLAGSPLFLIGLFLVNLKFDDDD